jgi:hypothetical protein
LKRLSGSGAGPEPNPAPGGGRPSDEGAREGVAGPKISPTRPYDPAEGSGARDGENEGGSHFVENDPASDEAARTGADDSGFISGAGGGRAGAGTTGTESEGRPTSWITTIGFSAGSFRGANRSSSGFSPRDGSE